MADGLKPCPICKGTYITTKMYSNKFSQPHYNRKCSSCWFECPELLWNKIPRHAGKWVKCSERLPEVHKEVLVIKEDGSMDLFLASIMHADYTYSYIKWYWYDGDLLADLGWEEK